MLSQRVEDLLEEVQAEKEKRGRDQESYTKEIKRCRKETYRAELAVVESRQDLQEVRAELKRCQAEIQHERTEKEKTRWRCYGRAQNKNPEKTSRNHRSIGFNHHFLSSRL